MARRNEKAINEYVGNLVSDQFRLLFMSYAKAINKQEGRVGSLFQKNFKPSGIHGLENNKTVADRR